MKRWVVGALVLAAGCSAGGMGPGGLARWKLGTNQAGYSVASAAKPNTVLIRGTWDFQIAADSAVTGTWSAAWLDGADRDAQVGPQVGSGILSGRLLSDGSLSLGLNPDLVDNNVWVEVRPESGSIGTWTWSTIAGPWSNGPFRLDPPIF